MTRRMPLYMRRAYPGDSPRIYRRLLRKLNAERQRANTAEALLRHVDVSVGMYRGGQLTITYPPHLAGHYGGEA